MNKILLGVAAGIVGLAAVLVVVLPPGRPEEVVLEVAPQELGEVSVAPLEDGRYFGYVSFKLDPAGSRVVVDFAHWFSGEEAVEAATREYGCGTASPTGPCENGRGSTPNGFFISNPDPWVVQEFELAPGARFTRVVMGPEYDGVQQDFPSTLEELAANAAPFREGPPEVIANVTVEGGKVVAVDEVYTP